MQQLWLTCCNPSARMHPAPGAAAAPVLHVEGLQVNPASCYLRIAWLGKKNASQRLQNHPGSGVHPLRVRRIQTLPRRTEPSRRWIAGSLSPGWMLKHQDCFLNIFTGSLGELRAPKLETQPTKTICGDGPAAVEMSLQPMSWLASTAIYILAQ